MAATVTFIRQLKADGALVSAFCKQSIKFSVASAPSGYYCEVSHDGVNFFKCTDLGSNVWEIDMNMLSSILLLPPTTITVTGLVLSTTFTVYVKTSAGATDATAVADSAALLCFGKPLRGVSGGMTTVNTTGRSRSIYHNGRYCAFSTTAYAITSTTSTTTGINYYAPDAAHKEIAWIDRDGKWSFWNFRYLSKSYENKASNEVPYYALTNALHVMSSYDISMESLVSLNFDTVAVNVDHYEQLCEISASPRVIYDGLVYRVKSSNSEVAACNQNYHFKLTLQREENAVSY